MAYILNPTMSLSTTADKVTITVSYTVRFGGHERLTLSTGSPALWFSEHIDILGAKYPLGFSSESLQPQIEDMPRQRTESFQRDHFEKGVLPTPVRCRIRVKVSPPTGAEAETNSAVVPSRAVAPLPPLTGFFRAIAPAVGGMVVGAIATALVLSQQKS
jgi:hypothetical protein